MVPAKTTLSSWNIDVIPTYRFSARESAAVSSWLESEYPFHIMRDHPNHGTQMLAGMWGAKLNNGTRDRYKEMLQEVFKNVSFLVMAFSLSVYHKG